MSPTKLSLAENNLIIPIHEEKSLVSDIPAGDGKTANFFYSVQLRLHFKICVTVQEQIILVMRWRNVALLWILGEYVVLLAYPYFVSLNRIIIDLCKEIVNPGKNGPLGAPM